MTAAHTLRRVRRWGWPTESSPWACSVALVVAGLALCWIVSVVLGGAGHIAPHWFYLPIFWAGLRFGRRGAAVTGAVAVVVAGPLLPADAATWSPQPVSDWVSRGLFFLGIGLVVAQLFVRLRRAGDVELRAGELRARLAVEARFRVLVETSHDVVTVLDEHGDVVSQDGPATTVFGAAAPSVGGRLDDLVHPDDRPWLQTTLDRLRRERGSSDTLVVRVAGEGGDWRHVESVIRDLRAEPAVGGLVLTSRDITDREALERELERRAHHDALTGLPNRVLLGARLEHALRSPAAGSGAAVGLLLVDLDRFKDVNDTLGHAAGDELLVQVAGRLTDALRGTDMVARLGGDEFAVLLPQVADTAGALAVAGKLHTALEQPFCVDGVELRVEASIGVVSSAEHGDDSAVLLQRADMAMYAAKRRGGVAVPFESAEHVVNAGRIALLGELRRALDEGELVLHYQPKIRLADGRLCGAEALVRWQHPSRGLLLPDEFLPAAEHTGLIGPLTSYVLDAALAQARRWVEDGQPLPVSVNLSARNLLQDDLPAEVARLLAAHQVPARLLELELTESAIMVEPDRSRRRLEELAGLGVQIAIDDFGAGYTSLGQLKDLPVSQLKVDRSFVAALASDPSSALIVRSIVDLGRHLGLGTVAEGVESADDAAALHSYGCDAAQGYYLSRPVPAAALDRWRSTGPPLASAPGDGGPLRLPRQVAGTEDRLPRRPADATPVGE